MSENRDDEQRQRQIDFIVESLARLTATVERVAEAQEGHEQRILRFERSYVAISDLLTRHDVQLEAVTNDGNATNAAVSNLIVTVDRLGVIVERYITARGNGSNGTSGGV
jgi:hypothetical protein